MAAFSTIAAVALAGFVVAESMIRESMIREKMPKLPDLPGSPTKTTEDADVAKKQAQTKARKTALAATGRHDTILTGPQGLAGALEPNTAAKTLLGT